jgi:hypothetical protein
MAISQPSWNGPTSESQRSHVRGRLISDNREASERIVDKPKLESFNVFAGVASPDITVSLTADGKNYCFRGNRRMLMRILSQASEAVFKMEPGAPPDPHK